MKNSFLYIFLFLPFIVASCTNNQQAEDTSLEDALSKIKKEIVADKRVAILELEHEYKDGKLQITGKSDVDGAQNQVESLLEKENITADINIQSLPDTEVLENKTHAVVNISVANIRSQPKHSGELATQATLGTPLKVLEKEDNWYRVQTPDKYISWVDAGGIILMNDEEYNNWIKSKKLIFLQPVGNAFVSPKNEELVSDLVGGDILKYEGEDNGYYQISFPDGRLGYIEKTATEFYDQWIGKLNPEQYDLISVSKKMMGTPYLWGGTSFKGVDCSGFTKTIYFMNGMVIPRDASQQVHAGIPVDTSAGFENLVPGDLLFFGRKATDDQTEKVVHVAMWLGNNEFIHASGRVRVNSFDPNADNYNEYELNRFLRARRILNQPAEKVIKLKDVALFQQAN
ncbi:C40 family peptidase [Chondrinema litorale]|uniref:C40 family peptidase n=1 Tax=Chondrinema litorale TaxID=2994555 RepID=UPI002542FF38|nr:C40 family peptidase [Chondrinema litorale]UZR94119.1 C40 family peptidase [Chondrinema litorale]